MKRGTNRSTIVERACAKVNLWLEVLSRRADGYHELETVMHEIDLADMVRVTPIEESTRFVVDDPTVGVGEDNLALKALRAVEAHVNRELPCRIELEKHIPSGGGLGGGSSDAAAVIRAVNRAFDLELGLIEMESIGATFGSDVSFFVRGGTSSCTGRGEIIEPLDVADRFFFVLIFPGFPIPTPLIFSELQLTDSPRQSYDFRRCLEVGNLSGMRRRLFNRLESPAIESFPRLARALGECAPHTALMSGSGSTIFILCDSEVEARNVRGQLQRRSDLETMIASSETR